MRKYLQQWIEQKKIVFYDHVTWNAGDSYLILIPEWMKNGLGHHVNETVLFYFHRSLFIFSHPCFWQHRRFFRQERDEFLSAGFLLFFQVRDDGLQIVIKF